MATTLKGQDILRADQFSPAELGLILETAARFEAALRAGEQADQYGRQGAGNAVL